MNSGKQQSGAWIFLSHSNKDFEKVREIRNELEKRGHKPIMFYLKCLENNNAMLPDLLRREIAAREAIEHGFILLLLSEASLKSQYCRQEALYALDKAAASRSSNVVPVVVSNIQEVKESLPPSLMFA